LQKLSLVAILLFGALSTTAQITDVEEQYNLPAVLSESSGVIFFNNRLISHNDSGNENILYELDPATGEITRTITVDNATNADWEDICQDSTSIYIGDIGNNNGDRTDLKIYKINKNDYLDTTHVSAEIINFNYADQLDFPSNPNNTEWDAEALFTLDTTLILLTKNWVTGISKAYPIPKMSGDYAVSPLPTPLNSEGLITGATFNEATGKLYSVGYTLLLQPFLWISEGFSGSDVFSGTNTRIPLTSLGLEQVEAITHIAPDSYFMTSESFSIPPFSEDAKLLSFSTQDVVNLTECPKGSPVRLFPNPTGGILTIDASELASIEIYDVNSRLVYHGNSREINISGLSKGIYFVKIRLSNSTLMTRRLIKI
jgi:hypothetical protein